MSVYRDAQPACGKAGVIPIGALHSSDRQQTTWTMIERGRTQVPGPTSFHGLCPAHGDMDAPRDLEPRPCRQAGEAVSTYETVHLYSTIVASPIQRTQWAPTCCAPFASRRSAVHNSIPSCSASAR